MGTDLGYWHVLSWPQDLATGVDTTMEAGERHRPAVCKGTAGGSSPECMYSGGDEL